MLTGHAEVQDAIRDLRISNSPGPDGIPNRALKHHPKRVILLLVLLFNAIFQKQYFPSALKHARVISILNLV
jgi:hypothetical protein